MAVSEENQMKIHDIHDIMISSNVLGNKIALLVPVCVQMEFGKMFGIDWRQIPLLLNPLPLLSLTPFNFLHIFCSPRRTSLLTHLFV